MNDLSPADYSPMNYKSSKEGYSMEFDLFKLNQFDSLRSIVYFKGKFCRTIFNELVQEVCLVAKVNRKSLSKQLSVRHSSDVSTIEKFIFSKDYFPIYLVLDLISFLPQGRRKYHNSNFNKAVEHFKFGHSKNWSKFPKSISKELVWLCGAVAADGWISKEEDGKERLGIIDFHKNALLKAKLFFEFCFGFNGNVVRDKLKNCWMLIVDSKAITRFFTTYLGFHYGLKVYDIREPEIVKVSDFRLDYASGVLTFDGSVEMDGVVSLGCASESLVKDVQSILSEAGLKTKFKKREMSKQTLFFVKSEGLLKHKDVTKWISLFGLDVEKGQRLDSLANGFKETPVSEEDALVRLEKFVNYTRRQKCPVYKIFFALKKEGSVKKQNLLKLTNLPHVTFYKYALLLRKANIISCQKGTFGRGVENVYAFNYKIEDWRVPKVS